MIRNCPAVAETRIQEIIMSASNRVILVLVDGLRFDTATHEMGFLEGAVHHGSARRWRMECALPSLSRANYETVHTGVPPHAHGITSNDIVRPSKVPNIFSESRKAGRRTAAAAYSWMSELYNGRPYDPVLDREIDDAEAAIQHGRFYHMDDFPDNELFAMADMLVRRKSPDYLLVHPMGCDHAGHTYGGESPEYRRRASKIDNQLSLVVPAWRDAGYHVVVTSDHGMDAHGWHGGTREEVRMVPFYHIGSSRPGYDDETVSQLSVAPTVLALMGIQPAETMKAPSLA